MAWRRRDVFHTVISDDAAQPRLRRVAVRRGFRLFVEVRREVGRRHLVKRGARERADELQSGWILSFPRPLLKPEAWVSLIG